MAPNTKYCSTRSMSFSILTFLFLFLSPANSIHMQSTLVNSHRSHSRLTKRPQQNQLYTHHIHVNKTSKYTKQLKINPSLFDPNHPDVPYLKTLSQFFKVYNSENDRAVLDAVKILNTVYGKEYLQRIDRFRGRASMFEKGGALFQYKSLLHELADYHNVPKSHAVNFSISFLEENADKWHLRVIPQQQKPEFDPIKSNWEAEEAQEKGDMDAMLLGAAEKEDETAYEKEAEAHRLQRKASEEKHKKLTAKNKLLSSGMAAGQTTVDEAQTNANMQGSRMTLIEVPQHQSILQENEERIKREISVAKQRVNMVIEKRKV